MQSSSMNRGVWFPWKTFCFHYKNAAAHFLLEARYLNDSLNSNYRRARKVYNFLFSATTSLVLNILIEMPLHTAYTTINLSMTRSATIFLDTYILGRGR